MAFETKDRFRIHLRIKKILTPYNPVKKMILINNDTKSKKSNKYLFYPKKENTLVFLLSS